MPHNEYADFEWVVKTYDKEHEYEYDTSCDNDEVEIIYIKRKDSNTEIELYSVSELHDFLTNVEYRNKVYEEQVL